MGNKTGSPRKAGFMREQLEKYVFGDEEVFAAWVEEHFTDAVKELGKLQPKTDKLELTGKDGGPIEYSDTERAARITALLDRGREERDRQADK